MTSGLFTAQTDCDGYGVLARLYADYCRPNAGYPALDVSPFRHIDPNLAPFFKAIMDASAQDFGIKLRTVTGIEPFPDLIANGLMRVTGFSDGYVENVYPTTLRLQGFMKEDEDSLCAYIEQHVLRHPMLANKKDDWKFHLAQCCREISTNYDLHAQSGKPLYICGHYYDDAKELRVTLIDLGIGFLSPIRAFTQHTDAPITDACAAIEWALKRRNTIRDDAPRGNGLSDILAACESTKADLHIAGDGCHWWFEGRTGRSHAKTVPCFFRGATIHIVFR